MTKKKTTNSQSTPQRRANAKTNTTRGGTNNRAKSGRSSTPRKPARRQAKSRTPQEIRLSIQQKGLIIGIVVVFLTAVLTLSLISPNQGELTGALFDMLWRVFGWGGLIIPFITGGIGLYLVLWGMDQHPPLPIYRLIGFAILFLFGETVAAMVVLIRNPGLGSVAQIVNVSTGGGYLGGLLAFILTQFVGNAGAIFTLVVLGFIGGILLTGVTRADVGLFLRDIQTAWQTPPPTPPAAAERAIPITSPRSAATTLTDAPTQLTLIPEAKPDARPATQRPTPNAPTPETRRPSRPTPTAAAPPTAVANPPATTPEPVFLGQHQLLHAWKLPALADMLESGSDEELNSASIREQVEVIEHTLESFGAPATVVEISQGPTITQFGVEPNFIEQRSGKRTKVKVGKIASLADDLALALAAHSIRIQAPVPGKGYVGIEVPNVAKALVSLRDVMESSEFQKIKSPLAIGLGQNVSGQAIGADLTKMPHLLIAGTTGSGKSVCVNGIIACLLLQNTPDNLKIVMVDPKRVELTGYNGVPHLAAPVVVEMDRVIGTLQWALREMDHRYKQFAEVGARNITDFNKKIKKEKDKEALPYIVIIIDELADLMMLAPEDTERAITRLAQMARATGIHMIIATQRPSVDVVTGLIKANFPARIAFAVASSTDSRVILDSTGAERLLGQGDMLFQSPDAAAPLRLQGCFVSDGELSKLIAYWQTARRFNLIPAQESITTRTDAPKPQTTSRRDTSALPPIPPLTPPTQAEPASRAVPAPIIRQDKGEADTVEPTPVGATAVGTTAVSETPTPIPPPQINLTRPKPEETKQRPLWEELQAMEAASGEPELEDDLLPEAIALVRKLNKASTSLLQRRFRIGYTRAARLMDYMDERGVIGPPTGTSKAREVLPPQEGEPIPTTPPPPVDEPD